jgi:hypothetical protein
MRSENVKVQRTLAVPVLVSAMVIAGCSTDDVMQTFTDEDTA